MNAMKTFGLLLLAAVGLVVWTQHPEIRRYIRMKKM